MKNEALGKQHWKGGIPGNGRVENLKKKRQGLPKKFSD